MPILKRPLLGLRAVSLPIRNFDFTCRESLSVSARSAQNPKSLQLDAGFSLVDTLTGINIAAGCYN